MAVPGSLMMFAALPPAALGWLAWIAPVPWLLLIRRPRFTGRWPYLKLWLSGFLFWFLALHWLRLPHPATSIGWVAVACYLGLYVPAFVALGRQAVHRLGLPFVIIAPMIWTGLELARAHLLSGFLMASLAHTQVHFISLIQISDLAGEYAVGFLVMLVASAIADMVARKIMPPEKELDGSKSRGQEFAFWKECFKHGFAPAVAVIALLVSIGYGRWRLGESITATGPRVALIQGNSLATWKQDAKKADRIMREYWLLSMRAVSAANRVGGGRPLDLVVWPETMFRAGLLEYTQAYADSPYAAAWEGSLPERAAVGPESIANLVKTIRTPVLLGIDTLQLDVSSDGMEIQQSTNSAVLADRSGVIMGCYDKVHLVMFGEYIPFANQIPILSRLTPVTLAVTPGDGPVGFESEGILYAPNICYESVLPHFIRRQVAILSARGQRPDVLVNLTNDAWYWGSSELDMHLACDVFRSVETRTPMVVAANGGLSAHIDSCGRIVEQSPRQVADVILADIALDRRVSLYAQWGDWFAWGCLVATGIVAILGIGRYGNLRRA